MKMTIEELKEKIKYILQHPVSNFTEIKLSEESKQYDRLEICRKRTKEFLERLRNS